jgi:hypothetical protein
VSLNWDGMVSFTLWYGMTISLKLKVVENMKGYQPSHTSQ